MKCQMCGIEFEPKASNQKYCGDECRKKAKRAQDEAYQKAYGAEIRATRALLKVQPPKAKPDPHRTLKDIVNAALAEGISYGAYVHKYGL